MKLLFPLIVASQLWFSQTLDPSPKYFNYSVSEKDSIECALRKEYNLDSLKINFKILPESDSNSAWGVYYSWADSLELNYYKIQRVASRNSWNSDTVIKHVMEHELTHYRVDKLQEKFCLKTEKNNKYSRNLNEKYVNMLMASERYPDEYYVAFHQFTRDNIKNLTNFILERMIDEGIAVYYDYPRFMPITASWPTSVNNIQSYNQYDMYIYYSSWNLMYPILSAYGETGLEYVLKNMPKYEDFSDLQGYQKRILKKLAEQK